MLSIQGLFSRNNRTFIVTLLLCLCAGLAHAEFDPVNDDTDIFLTNPNLDANRPNVLLIIDNTANWNSVFDNEQAALVQVIESLGEEYNVGTMLFAQTGSGNNNVDGGNVRFAIRQMTDTNKALLAGIYDDFVNEAAAQGGDKSNNAIPALAMLEAYRYFSGGYSYATHGKETSDYTAIARSTRCAPGSARSGVP